VFGERIEHVVEKIDVGVDRDRAAVEREPQIDLRLFRAAFDDRATVDQLRSPFFAAPLAAPFDVPLP
jgi:hypothetical protein